jgi:transcriptional regulator with XRE-family HTH domain
MKIHTEKIKELREKLGISQEDISEQMAMSQTAYSRFETGETKLDFEKLARLADILRTDPISLVKSYEKNVTLNNSSHNVVSDYIENQYMMIDKDIIEQLKDTLNILNALIQKIKN